ncbi:DUF5806 family protein [Haladaptatus sp. NG-SE-30]
MSNDPSPPEPETEDERDDTPSNEHDTPSDDSDMSVGTRQEATDAPYDAPEPAPDAQERTPDTADRASETHDPTSNAPDATSDTADSTSNEPGSASDAADSVPELPPDVQKYARFKKMDGAQYERVNEFLRDRTYITAREWAIARLCADFRTETGVEMTKIGDNLPYLIPFMTDTYTPQAVNQARSAFEEKVRKAGATFLYGAMSSFFTAEELDDVMYEVTEVAKFLLEVEGVDLSVDEELAAEDRISNVMREVRESSEQLRHDEMECPHCGREIGDEE